MRLRTALLAMTAMVAAPVVASASTITGPYVNIGAGYNLVQNQHAHFAPGSFADGSDNAGGTVGNLRHKNGYTGFASFGWGFGNGLRAEVEGVYNWSQINHRGGTAVPGSTSGHDRSYGGFINVLYDIDLTRFGLNLPMTPYVGVGAGYLWQSYSFATAYTNGLANGINQTRGGFAYQGIIGAAWDIPGVPGLAVTTEYRMIGQTFGAGAYTAYTGNEDGLIGQGNANFDHRFNHQFILGMRYAFDTAPPPPPPAPVVTPPAVAPARTYLVFFDWDKSTLTSRASEIVRQAAEASTHVQTTRIEVNGYTDNSAAHPGARGQRYNLGLSERRAKAVKAELIRNGVPETAIDIHGYGEQHPLVPTGPNTREPQNRRVEIILR